MLDGLDAIRWSELSHAYGPADDVPETLRALASGTVSAEEAVSEFWGSIWHQGTVYQATAHAVPFLVELLQADIVRDKQWLLMLLAGLAAGASGRKAHVAESHAAVSDGVPVFLRLLRDAAPQVRTTAAYTLSQFPERGTEIAPALEWAVAHETDADAEASLMLSLEAVAGPTPGLAGHADRRLSPGTEERVRLVASLILARRAGPDTPPPVIRVLRDSLTHGEEVSKAYVFSVWEKEVDKEVCEALWGLGETFAVPLLLGLLPEVGGGLAAYSVADILLEKKFTQTWGRERAASVGMTQEQRRILAAFVDEPTIWQGNALKTLEWHYGLPADREALRVFLHEEAE